MPAPSGDRQTVQGEPGNGAFTTDTTRPSSTEPEGRRLDALVTRTVPRVRKAVKWNAPFYGVEGQGWFLGVHCFTRYVKLDFFRGAALAPLPPVASRDPNARYVHIHETDALDEERLATWIRQAAALPGWVL